MPKNKKPRTYEDGVRDALKALDNVKGGGCLCGHFDPCHGGCKADPADYYKAIKKLLK